MSVTLMPGQKDKYVKKYHLDSVFTEEMLAYFRLMEYEKGEIICSEGAVSQIYQIVMEGVARVTTISEKGKQVLLGYVRPMSIVGDMEFWSGNSVYYHEVVAECRMIVLVIPFSYIKEHLLENVAFLRMACNELTMKLVTSSINRSDVMLLPAKNRLAKYLCEQVKSSNSYTIIFHSIEVAQILGISDKQLRRLVTALVEEKAISRTGKKITVLNMEQIIQEA